MFEKDIDALRQALADTEDRIKRLEGHREAETRRPGNPNDETINRLERNLDNLRKRRDSIMREIKG